MLKKCSKCWEYKTLEEFHRSRNAKYGRYHQCKKCTSLCQAIDRRIDPEMNKIRCKKTYYKNRDKRIAGSILWAKQNPEKTKQYSKNHYNRYIDKHRAQGRDYYDKYSHRIRAHYHKNSKQIKQSYRYVVGLLCNNTTLKPADIPIELIELKLTHMKLKRLIKELKK